METKNRNTFNLSKVKLIKNGGIEAHYTMTEALGNEVYHNEHQIKDTKDIHPDLMNCFKEMRVLMAQLFGVYSFTTLMNTPDFKANAKQKDLAEAFADEASKKIEVRGISISGEDDNVGVVITGLYEFSNGMKSAINSPRIRLAGSSFGFEDELQAIVERVKDEVFAFLFEGKKAQLELF